MRLKNLLLPLGIGLALVALAAVNNEYHGTFIGDGSQLNGVIAAGTGSVVSVSGPGLNMYSNSSILITLYLDTNAVAAISGTNNTSGKAGMSTNAINATNFWGLLSTTNIPSNTVNSNQLDAATRSMLGGSQTNDLTKMATNETRNITMTGSNYFTGTEYMAGAVRMADGSLLATNATARTNASGGVALSTYGGVITYADTNNLGNNVSAGFFWGDGSHLSGVSGGSGTGIATNGGTGISNTFTNTTLVNPTITGTGHVVSITNNSQHVDLWDDGGIDMSGGLTNHGLTATSPLTVDTNGKVISTTWQGGSGTGSTNIADVGTNNFFRGNLYLTNAGSGGVIFSNATDVIGAFTNGTLFVGTNLSVNGSETFNGVASFNTNVGINGKLSMEQAATNWASLGAPNYYGVQYFLEGSTPNLMIGLDSSSPPKLATYATGSGLTVSGGTISANGRTATNVFTGSVDFGGAHFVFTNVPSPAGAWSFPIPAAVANGPASEYDAVIVRWFNHSGTNITVVTDNTTWFTQDRTTTHVITNGFFGDFLIGVQPLVATNCVFLWSGH